MNWVKDTTGRFPERPHYEPEELDFDCQEFAHLILRNRHDGKLVFPIPTDDLTVMIERSGADLDQYADLSNEGSNVEGVTEFTPGMKPRVRISHLLTDDARLENRLRTTLTHECGHVRHHRFLWEMKAKTGKLFPDKGLSKQACKRENLVSARTYDWMEWQAGYCCGALLMPITNVKDTVRAFMFEYGIDTLPIEESSPKGQAFVSRVAFEYGVSRQAASVRLIRLRALGAGCGAQSSILD